MSGLSEFAKSLFKRRYIHSLNREFAFSNSEGAGLFSGEPVKDSVKGLYLKGGVPKYDFAFFVVGDGLAHAEQVVKHGETLLCVNQNFQKSLKAGSLVVVPSSLFLPEGISHEDLKSICLVEDASDEDVLDVSYLSESGVLDSKVDTQVNRQDVIGQGVYAFSVPGFA